MKFTIEGRATVLDVMEAENRIEALKKFYAKYPYVDKIVSAEEGTTPRKRHAEKEKP
jgi:hypothetical protein